MHDEYTCLPYAYLLRTARSRGACSHHSRMQCASEIPGKDIPTVCVYDNVTNRCACLSFLSPLTEIIAHAQIDHRTHAMPQVPADKRTNSSSKQGGPGWAVSLQCCCVTSAADAVSLLLCCCCCVVAAATASGSCAVLCCAVQFVCLSLVGFCRWCVDDQQANQPFSNICYDTYTNLQKN